MPNLTGEILYNKIMERAELADKAGSSCHDTAKATKDKKRAKLARKNGKNWFAVAETLRNVAYAVRAADEEQHTINCQIKVARTEEGLSVEPNDPVVKASLKGIVGHITPFNTVQVPPGDIIIETGVDTPEGPVVERLIDGKVNLPNGWHLIYVEDLEIDKEPFSFRNGDNYSAATADGFIVDFKVMSQRMVSNG